MLRETISTESLIADDAVAGSVSFFLNEETGDFAKKMGMGQNPGTFCSHQNSWDLWM